MSGISAPLNGAPQSSLAPSAVWRAKKKSVAQKRILTWPCGHPDLWLPVSRTMGNKLLFISHPVYVWYFVLVAQTNENNVPRYSWNAVIYNLNEHSWSIRVSRRAQAQRSPGDVESPQGAQSRARRMCAWVLPTRASCPFRFPLHTYLSHFITSQETSKS